MNKKITVLVINQFASLPKYSYGAGERMFHLSEFLYKEGFNVQVVSGAFNHLFKEYPATPKLFNVEQTKYLDFIWVRLKRYKSNNFIGRVYSWFEFLFKLFLFPIGKGPEIVVVSSMSIMPIIYALWVKRKYKSKFVLEIRDIWPLTPIEIGGYSKNNPLMIFLRQIELLAYRNADHIISVLPGFRKYLNENNFDSKLCTWIPNGVSSAINLSNNDNELRKFLNEKKFNVLYAGTFGKANALESLIDAARLLEEEYMDIHITLIGDGPLEHELKEMSKELSNVSFIGKVLKSELGAILTEADVCYIGWHDRRIYNYGVSANKYNDYMLAKKPILSSSNIENDPATLSNGGIQVMANDPRAIAAGIVQLYAMNEEERTQYGLNGYNFVTESQVYPVLADKYITVFNQVLGKYKTNS